MNQILLSVIIVSAIGLLVGLMLAIAAKVFAVPVNKTAEDVRACLPGANCGACGFSGCDGYAAAIADGQTDKLNLCGPGGVDAYAKIAEVMGAAATDASRMVAVVLCQGHNNNVGVKLDYKGVSSCKMAAQLFGGPRECTYGCLGFGDCVEKCNYEAIFMCDGVARINPNLCQACRQCIKVCPRGLIEMYPIDELHAGVFCKNREKGAVTRQECKQGCLGCGICVKTCPNGAITLENNAAHIDYHKCTGCGECVKKCPVGAINMITH